MATRPNDDETLDFGPAEVVGNKTDVSSALDKFVTDTMGDIGEQADVEIAPTDGKAAEADQGTAKVAEDSSSGKSDGGKQPENKEQAKAPTAGPGDLTLADGTIVKAGAERRIHDQLQIARQETTALRNTINQHVADKDKLRTELNATRSAIEATHGTDPQTVGAAVTLYKQLKLDPTGTLRLLLTEAAAAGYSVDAAKANPGGLDVAAITAQIRNELAPLLAPLQTQNSQQQIEQDTASEVNNFYSMYPDARIHDSTIAAVIEADPRITLSEAYFQLRHAVAARGLDWTKPLAQQVRPATSEQQQQVAPLNGGRPVVNAVPATRVPIAADNASTGDIIRAAMRDAGLSS